MLATSEKEILTLYLIKSCEFCHDLLHLPITHHSEWSVITARNLTAVKHIDAINVKKIIIKVNKCIY